MPLDQSIAIELPKLNIQKLEIVLVGDSPLITHRWSEKAKKEMLDKQMKKAKAAKQAKDPWMDFCESLYWLTPMPERPTEQDIASAKFGLPTVAFKAAAVTACTSTGNITKVAARQAFYVDGDMVEIIGPAPKMREDMVRVGMGTADIRYRGEFHPWAVKLSISFNANVLSAEQIVNLMNTAGFGVGVFEWRGEKDGQMGRFHVATADEMEALTE
jgi:hypothetical protein